MNKRDARLREKVEAIDNRGRGLSTWEIDFIAGFIDQKVYTFTDKQAEVINRIYEERVARKPKKSEDDDL